MMRTGVLVVALLGLVGCDDEGGDGGSTDSAGATTGAVGSSSSGATPSSTSDDGASAGTSATSPTTAGETTADASGTTTGAGEETSAGETTADADASSGGGSDDGGGSIDVTLSGCDVDFGGSVVVTYNGSLGVASVYDNGGTLSGSFQFDLVDGAGTMTLSTQHRVDTGNVINMVDVAQGTWTNMDSDALTGGVDSIGGTLTVDVWNPSRGQADITFSGVSLMNVVNGNVCTIDGTVVAEELYP